LHNIKQQLLENRYVFQTPLAAPVLKNSNNAAEKKDVAAEHMK